MTRGASTRWAAAASVAAVTAVLGAVDIGRRSYWTDEAYNIVLVREGWVRFVRTIVAREPSQAIYLMFFKPWTAVVGAHEALSRAPSLVAAVLATFLLVLLGCRLFDLATGVLAGLLLATNASFIEWSQYARTYTLAALAAVVTTYLFVRATARADTRSWLVYGAAGALSIYCHFYAGFVLVGHAATFFATRPRLPLRRLATAWAVIGVGLVPFAAYVVAGTRAPVEWIPPISGAEVWHAVEFTAGSNALLLVAAVAGAVVLGVSRQPGVPDRLAILAGWIVAPLLCGLVVSLVQPALVSRFLIVSAPAVALLAAVAIVQCRSRALGAAVAVLVVAFAVPRFHHVYRQNPEDWRAAARAARAAHAHGATVAVVPDFGWRALSIYAPQVPLVFTPSGSLLALVVNADGKARDAAVDAFIGSAPYRRVTVRAIAPGLALEEWRRTTAAP